MTVHHLIDASIRSLLIAGLAGLLLAVARAKLAAFEHLIWTAVMISMLVFAIPRALTPKIPVPVNSSLPLLDTAPLPQPRATLVVTTDPEPSARSIPWQSFAFWIWLAGAALNAVGLIAGSLLIRYKLRSAKQILTETAAPIEESSYVTVPLTVGWPNPRIILPLVWHSWPAAKLNAVLAHEQAHIEGHDTLILLLTAINRAIFWFHPLAWFLARKLSELAEFAADQAALAAAPSRNDYARFLVEIASHANGKRVLSNGVAMDGLGKIQLRTKRIFEEPMLPKANGRAFWCCAAPVIGLFALLQLQPVLSGQAPAITNAREEEIRFSLGHQLMSFPPQDLTRGPGGFSPAEVAIFEQRLRANPLNDEARLQLAVYYSRAKQTGSRLALIDWLIDNQPASFLHCNSFFVVNPLSDGRNAYEGVHARWTRQLQLHPDNAYIALNAAKSVGQSSMTEELAILKQAQLLDPRRFTILIAQIYGVALTSQDASRLATPDLLAQVHQDLASSNDPLLLGKTGGFLVEIASRDSMLRQPAVNFAAIRSLAISVLARAQSLDPRNQDWSDSLEGAKRLNFGTPAQPTAQIFRVGAGIMKANLTFSPEPKQQPLKGTVKFQATIDKTGRIVKLTLLGGPPALANPAIEAVRQYVYQPLLINGNPVDVETTVEITFN